jgi:hypothetical protein
LPLSISVLWFSIFIGIVNESSPKEWKPLCPRVWDVMTVPGSNGTDKSVSCGEISTVTFSSPTHTMRATQGSDPHDEGNPGRT